VPDFALVTGVPAKRIGWVSRAGEPLGPQLICPRDGTRYREVADERLEEMPVKRI
jgi:UDP-2-acetamido-3-amino-2,3-dideoxy-glucuronate N-acetyltransferase